MSAKQRRCDKCKTDISAKRNGTLFCSKECQERSYNEKQRLAVAYARSHGIEIDITKATLAVKYARSHGIDI